ncbi:MAG: substrate-binding domain-containing protein [Spirochaetia bacterium]|nr:substrate-binding domain-containing protein [Spirochaetia bacterium]
MPSGEKCPTILRMRIAYIHAAMHFESYLGSHIYDEVRRGIADACRRRKIRCDYFDQNLNLKNFLNQKTFLRYSGLLGTVPGNGPSQKYWSSISKQVPVINLMTRPRHSTGGYVGTNEQAGMNAVVAHLQSEGHSSIGYFGIMDEPFALERFRSLVAALRESRVPTNQKWIHGFNLKSLKPEKPWKKTKAYTTTGDKKLEAFLEKRFRALKKSDLPAAMVFESDLSAVLFAARARTLGIRIPEDLAITGYDRNLTLHGILPGFSLSSVEQDFYQIGKTSVALLLGMKSPGTKSEALIPPRFAAGLSSRLKSRKKSSDKNQPFLLQVRSYLEEHYAEDGLSKSISAGLGLNHKYFLEKFSMTAGETFVDAVNQLRLDEAARRLRESAESITRILQESGFGTHQNFNRLFKKKFGVSAAAWRRGLFKSG